MSEDQIPVGYNGLTEAQIAGMRDADAEHELKSAQERELAALRERLAAAEEVAAKYEKTNQATSAKLAASGGEPVAHHLHLVDGRVISNHAGIATHYSETDSAGNTAVTRVHAHYPVNEPDPTTVYA